MTLPSNSITKAFFDGWKPTVTISEGKVERYDEKNDVSSPSLFDFSEASTAISLPKLGKRSKMVEEEN